MEIVGVFLLSTSFNYIDISGTILGGGFFGAEKGGCIKIIQNCHSVALLIETMNENDD